jgi:hypothetical protein
LKPENLEPWSLGVLLLATGLNQDVMIHSTGIRRDGRVRKPDKVVKGKE